MCRLLKYLLTIIFLLSLPLLLRFYYADQEQRNRLLVWVQQYLDQPLQDSLGQLKQEIKQVNPEQLLARLSDKVEDFQQLATCGKTETSAVEEESNTIYRWVDEQGKLHFGDQQPSGVLNTEQLEISYSDRKRYFNLEIIEDTSSLPPFTHDKVSSGIRQIYGILSRDLALAHLRQVMLRVRIIESQEAFQEYKNKVAPQLKTYSGFYTSQLNEAVVHQGENPQSMHAVIRHEASHVIVAGLYGYTPVWFNEGLAEYFEYLEIRGQLRQIYPVRQHMKYLRNAVVSEKLMPLRDYLELTPEQWYSGNLEQNYAMAWSIIYFLMGQDEGKKLLQGMMNQLADNYCWQFSSLEYVEQQYSGGIDMFEQRWRDWLQQEPKLHRY